MSTASKWPPAIPGERENPMKNQTLMQTIARANRVQPPVALEILIVANVAVLLARVFAASSVSHETE